MIHPPDGVLTLVFAEAESSAETVDACLAARGGYEVKRIGTRLMAAFKSALDAARFALDLQERGVDARVGIHTGEPICEADPGTGKADYFGPAVNRAARIAEAANPGQALFSLPALEAAGDALREAVVTPLGEHRMKGLERPEPLFQVLHASRRGRAFPPLRTLSALPTNLPVQTTTFVGREHELRELEALFTSGARLVTLTGTAGVGKTRLAVRVGAELLGRFAGGCWFADLLEAGSAGDGGSALAGVAAQALGVAVGGGAAIEQVAAVLSARRSLLLILDTWDVARPGAAEALKSWMSKAPELRVLATGRSATGLQGEHEMRVEPFPVPARARPEDAVRLFVERAREAKPEFSLTLESEEDVAAICRELEGIPLAIELAAARVKIMQPAMMRRKLGQKFQLLKSARQDAAQRQLTLAGAIEWGLETLSPEERRVFLRLSVFRGGFLAEYAAQVVGPEATPERIEALRARSLLAARDYPWGRRYLVYRLIHEYAEREWRASSTPEERLALERRHAESALAYFKAWEEKAETSLLGESLDRLEAAMENIAAVQERALARAAASASTESAARELEIAARAVGCLTAPFSARGAASDWLTRAEPALQAVLAHPEAANRMDPEVHAALLSNVSEAARAGGDNARAATLAADAVASAARCPNSVTMARSLRVHAWHEALSGRFVPALAALQRAVGIVRARGLDPVLSEIENMRGLVLRRSGDASGALESFREAYRLARDAGAAALEHAYATNIGTTLEMLGQLEEAIEWYERAEKGAESLGRLNSIAINLANRANLMSLRGDHAIALATLARAEGHARDLGRPAIIAACLAMRSAALGRAGRHAEGLEASFAAEKIFRDMGDRALVASLIGERALLQRALNDLPGAERSYEASVALFEALGNRSALLTVVTGFASFLRESGRASTVALSAALQYRAGCSPLLLFEALAELALAEASAGRQKEALVAAKEAQTALGASGNWESTMHASVIRAALSRVKGILPR
ncbi:MAG: adenylate/guanylate cyclase domain-containing [Planctomycetota bacterium]|nr:MAG: adenylate/guanylate cyclase domain-containing [Planctomycetota bacterium]